MMVTKTSENRQQLADAQMQNYSMQCMQHAFCSGNQAIINFGSWFDHTTARAFFLSQYWLQHTCILFAWDLYSSVCIQQGHLRGRLFANCPHTDCPGWSGLVGNELPGPKGAHLRFWCAWLVEVSVLTLFAQYWYLQLVVPGSYLHRGLRHMAADRCSQLSSQYLMDRNFLFAETCQGVIRCYHVAKCMGKGPCFCFFLPRLWFLLHGCFTYYELLKLLERLCRTETSENPASGWGDHRESAGGAASRSTCPWKHKQLRYGNQMESTGTDVQKHEWKSVQAILNVPVDVFTQRCSLTHAQMNEKKHNAQIQFLRLWKHRCVNTHTHTNALA